MNEKCDTAFLNNIHLTQEEFCSAVYRNCSQLQSTVNFFTLNACYIRNRFLMAAILLIVFFFIFKLIYDAVKNYMAPALLFLSRFFGLSQSVAGVTLLAFASGVGDIATAFTASKTEEAVSYIVGSLFGSAIFVLTIIVAATIHITSEPIIIKKGIVLRDLGFLALGTFMLLIYGWNGRINVFRAILFFLLYFTVVLVIFVQEKFFFNELKFTGKDFQARIAVSNNFSWEESSFSVKNSSAEIKTPLKPQNEIKSTPHIIFPYEDSNLKSLNIKSSSSVFLKMFSFLEKIGLPTIWVLNVTVLPCSVRNFSSKKVILWPFLGIPLILFGALEKPNMIWLYYLPFAASMSVALYFCMEKEEIYQSTSFGLIITVLSAISTIFWIKIVSSVLIDAIVFIGVATQLPGDVLAFTIISTGNALPEVFITMELAKRGQGVMAITGIYAGQIFGILFGFGISMLKRWYYLRKDISFGLFSSQEGPDISFCLPLIGFCLLILLVTAIFLVINNYKFDKGLRNALLVLYMIFIVYTIVTIFAKNEVSILLHRLRNIF